MIWRQEKAENMGYGGSGMAFVDADGKGEILLTCADGNLYCLDQAWGQ